MEKQRIRKQLFGSHDPYADFSPLPENLFGWASDSSAFNDVLLSSKPKCIIEVGSYLGKSAVNMAKIMLNQGIDDFEIVCVDTWLGSVEHWLGDEVLRSTFAHGRPTLYEQFISNIIHQKLTDYITPFPVDSINAAEYFVHSCIESDLIYVDAGHDYLSVKADLIAYSNVVKKGGYILGDDWQHGPVKNAVQDVFGIKNVISKSSDKFLWKKPE